MIAAATIWENPERYGFADTGVVAPFRFCTREVPGGTPLWLLAEASSSDVSAIRVLNPELMTGITPPGRRNYPVRLPADTSIELFNETLKTGLPGKRVIDTVQLSATRKKFLVRLLKRYGTTQEDFTLVNHDRGLHFQKLVYIPLFKEPGGGKRTAKYRKATGKRISLVSYERARKKVMARL